ncbi:MAG: FAD-dependent oxidoreductase [Gammaproteobacteria bacterium]|nr:FAD-dependent oxidoreductase [Gammaproteobacteria bacterium]
MNTPTATSERPSIAIVGGGIAGLSAAFHLQSRFRVTLFEAQSKLGGHTDTHEFDIDGAVRAVDSGFIVFCRRYYPHFSAMLEQLAVPSQATTMSFSAHNLHSGVMYNATSLNRLFCQRRNLVSPRFYRMLLDLVRFYTRAPAVLKTDDHQTSVADYLRQHHYSTAFSDDHLLPMISALWSATPQRVAEFPIRHLVEFLHNHGMMNLWQRPDWEVVKGGSERYVDALREQLDCHLQTGSEVRRIERQPEGVQLETDAHQSRFDAVVIATHADQALILLADPSPAEQSILSAIPFESNHVLVHQDESVMPPLKSAWACWNTEVPNDVHPQSQYCCTAHYWMNELQGLEMAENVFVSLNSRDQIDASKVLAERHYSHPIFSAQSVTAIRQLPEINGRQRTAYAGAFWGWGFHEDGARSGWQAAQQIERMFR